MANPFAKLFKRDTGDTASNNTGEATNGDTGNVSDVLLTSIINGEAISREQALSIPSVSADVDFIAAMPVKLYKRKDKRVEEITDDPRVRFLNADTGDTLDAFQMKKALVTDYLLGKGGYCFIRRNRNTVTGLYYVEDDYICIIYDYQPIYKTYVIDVYENQYQPYEFIKILRNTKNGAWGTGVIDELNQALETAYQTMIYQLGLVKTGGNKRGFLKSETKLTDEAMRVLKAAWSRLYANNTDNVVVLNKGLDFKEASNTSVEMQLNETVDKLDSQIDKIFHISSDFNETFKFAIYPIVKAFETALNRDLLLEKEKNKYFFEFDVKEIVKADIKSRYEVYRMSKECQMTTINERRRMENLGDIEGGDVIDLGLGSVLYDVNTQKYYTPNTDTTSDGNSDNGADIKTIEEESFIDDLNGSEARAEELRYNMNHGKDGRFTSGGGGGSGKGSSGGAGGGSKKSKSNKSGGSSDDKSSGDSDSKAGGKGGSDKSGDNDSDDNGGAGGGGSSDDVKSQVEAETEKVKSRLSNEAKPFKKEAEADIDKVKERGGVNDEDAQKCIDVAEGVYKEAEAKEPQITSDVVGAVEGVDGQMYGLDYRMKQPTSMAGKIASDANEKNISYDEAGSDIKDAIRYTAVVDKDNFVSDYNDIKANLEDKGYTEVRCKNFYNMYETGDSCQKAVQCVFKDKDGYSFELQFHTPESQGAKELNHPKYELFRAETTSPAKKAELKAEMTNIGTFVPNPDGISSIESHN